MKEVLGSFHGFLVQESESEVFFKGVVYAVRSTKRVTFVILTNGKESVQLVFEGEVATIRPGSSLKGRGIWQSAQVKGLSLTYRNQEIVVESWDLMGTGAEEPAFTWWKKELEVSGESHLNHRPLSLRHEKEKAVFSIQNTIVQEFRRTLEGLGFIEQRSPKLCAQGAEGGANVFSLGYFGKTAYLAQSPQFYKEFGTGIFQKVFEIGPVFRAEKHNTSRHLNEYTSLDLEFGPIESFYEVMELEVLLLQRIIKAVKETNIRELNLLEVTLPETICFPSMTFREAKEALGKEASIEKDLTPKEEKLLGEIAKEKWNSEFLFVTHYPCEARPFYTQKESCKELTSSFDLLFKGQEITTGGQRIHEYEEIVNSIKKKGLEPLEFEFFLQSHRAGLPPHGGLGLGLERLTCLLLNLGSVKRCVAYPRDVSRLSP